MFSERPHRVYILGAYRVRVSKRNWLLSFDPEQTIRSDSWPRVEALDFC